MSGCSCACSPWPCTLPSLLLSCRRSRTCPQSYSKVPPLKWTPVYSILSSVILNSCICSQAFRAPAPVRSLIKIKDLSAVPVPFPRLLCCKFLKDACSFEKNLSIRSDLPCRFFAWTPTTRHLVQWLCWVFTASDRKEKMFSSLQSHQKNFQTIFQLL